MKILFLCIVAISNIISERSEKYIRSLYTSFDEEANTNYPNNLYKLPNEKPKNHPNNLYNSRGESSNNYPNNLYESIIPRHCEVNVMANDINIIGKNNYASHKLAYKYNVRLEGYVVGNKLYYNDGVVDVSNKRIFNQIFESIISENGIEILKIKLKKLDFESIQNLSANLHYNIDISEIKQGVNKELVDYLLTSKSNFIFKDNEIFSLIDVKNKGKNFDQSIIWHCQQKVRSLNNYSSIKSGDRIYYYDKEYNENNFEFKFMSGQGNLCSFHSIIGFVKIHDSRIEKGNEFRESVRSISNNGSAENLKKYISNFILTDKYALNDRLRKSMQNYISNYMTNELLWEQNISSTGIDDLITKTQKGLKSFIQSVKGSEIEENIVKLFSNWNESLYSQTELGISNKFGDDFLKKLFSRILKQSTMNNSYIIFLVSSLMDIPCNVFNVNRSILNVRNEYSVEILKQQTDAFNSNALFNVLLYSSGYAFHSDPNHFSLLLNKNPLMLKY